MNLGLIGCGRLGLVIGSCLARLGHHIVCSDSDPTRITLLRGGRLPVHEPHLENLVQQGLAAGSLSFTSDLDHVLACETLFLCVSAVFQEDGRADLSPLDRLARTIARDARGTKVVVLCGTVPVGTAKQMGHLLAIHGRPNEAKFSVVSNPQFLREGAAVHDFLHPDFILLGVGGDSGRSLQEVYGPIVEGNFSCVLHPGGCPTRARPELLVTTPDSAELIKHAANSFLALKVSYANAVADLCEQTEADVEAVTQAMGLDPRIGGRYLKAGLGFGGFRLTTHLHSLIRLSESLGVDAGLLREAERINRRRVEKFLEIVRRALWVMKDKKIAVLGLAYKADTDDISFSPSVPLIRALLTEGAQVVAFDPAAAEKVRAIFPDVLVAGNEYEAGREAEALMILTDAREFAELNWQRMRGLMARPVIVDGRNLLDPARMRALGFEYHGVGRP